MDEETKLLAGMGKFRIKAKYKIPIKEGKVQVILIFFMFSQWVK